MHVLILNGSPHKNGNTSIALKEMENIFEQAGVTWEMISLGQMDIRSCIGCNSCSKTGQCVFDDLVNETAPKLEAADGLVLASPVYYAGANPTLTAFVTRLFYSTSFSKNMKVGASVVVARRGGTTAAFDALNKFFTISGMPIASGRYWNNVFGCVPGESEADAEGLRNVRIVARNMVFLMRSIALGKEAFGLPEIEQGPATNFIRP